LELLAVPALPFVVVLVEIMDFFARWQVNGRVLIQQAMKGGGSPFLGA